MSLTDFTRRDFVKLSLASAFGVSYSGWLPKLAHAAEAASKAGAAKHKSFILLWMTGGPTQTDTVRFESRARERRAVEGD